MSGDAAETADHKRRDLIKVARRHFLSHGYASTGMEAIAREAAVSTATLYAFFPSKSDLFSRVIDSAADDFARQMASVHTIAGDARSQLLAFATTYANFMGDPLVRAVFRLVMAERRRFESTAIRFFEKGRSEFGAILMGCLKELTEAGALDVAKPSWAAGQLMGMIEHPVFFVPLVTGDDVKAARSSELIAADAVDTFMARYGRKA